jgi:MinD-like ATPase involved in chromosome partitioning or flagellar assembly
VSVVLFTSAKGAPGASTISYEVVGRYNRRVVGFEVDASGGSWAITHGLSHDPGLLSLAASRDEFVWETFVEHGHRVGEHGVVVCSAPGRDTAAALSVLEPRLRSFPTDLDVVLDVGRFHDGVTNLARSAQLVVVVSRPHTADIAALKRQCDELVHLGCRVNVALVGEEPHSRSEVMEFLGVPVLEGVVPFDPIGMQRFIARGRSKRFDRIFNRLTREIADRVAYTPVVEVSV